MLKLHPFKHMILIGIGAIVLPAVKVWLYLSDEVEYARFHDPSDRYEAVVTYPKYVELLAGWFGDRRQCAGTVRIYQADGQYCGAQTIAAVAMASEMQWETDLPALNPAREPLIWGGHTKFAA